MVRWWSYFAVFLAGANLGQVVNQLMPSVEWTTFDWGLQAALFVGFLILGYMSALKERKQLKLDLLEGGEIEQQ